MLQEPAELSNGTTIVAAEHVLLRSTGVAKDLGFPDNQPVNSIVDFFKPDPNSIQQNEVYPSVKTDGWKLTLAVKSKDIPNTYFFEEYKKLLTKPVSEIEKSCGYLVHLAEGRAGNLLESKKMDAYSKKEFDYFKEEIKKIPNYREKVKASKISIIHGCGIDLNNDDNIAFLQECEIGIIWSPVSNLLLYGDTPAFFRKIYDKCNISLGSDWAPSGSKHVWDEGDFAQICLYKPDSDNKNLTDKILDMMTVNPAKAIRATKLGKIEQGYFADFYILSRNPQEKMTAGEPIGNLFWFSDYCGVATIINGNLVYGDQNMFESFGQSYVRVPAGDNMMAKFKCVHVPAQLDINVAEDIAALDKLFASYTGGYGGKRFIRSEFLSVNDSPYSLRINELANQYRFKL